MRKTKKFLALALATGLMLSSMTVFAEEENNTPPRRWSRSRRRRGCWTENIIV